MKLHDVLSCLMKDDAFKGRGKYHSQVGGSFEFILTSDLSGQS